MKAKKITEMSGNKHKYTIQYGPYHVRQDDGSLKQIECLHVIYLDGMHDVLHVGISEPNFCEYVTELKDDVRYIPIEQFKVMREEYKQKVSNLE